MAYTLGVSVTSSPTLCRPALEVADIVRAHGADYLLTHSVSREQRQVLRDIRECRTAALGGHVDVCNHCRELRIAYNSCRNRHCPKCGATIKAEWVEKQKAHLLPVHYFHVVFTSDHDFLPLVRANQQLLYGLLMRTAGHTLTEMARRYLHGEIGVVAILHTWGQQLTEHPHVHCLVTGGALVGNGRRWRSTRPDFLFPIEALSQLFRDKFCAGVEKLHQQGKLTFAGQSECWQDPDTFAEKMAVVRQRNWQVYAKPPFADAEQVVDYLGRYTQRIALSNSRLVDLEAGQVSFRYRDYRQDGVEKVLHLDATEFLRRYLLHVLPWGFVRIRYYGLLATALRARKLALCRRLLRALPLPQRSRETLLHLMLGRPANACPACQLGRFERRHQLKPLPHRRAWLHAVQG